MKTTLQRERETNNSPTHRNQSEYQSIFVGALITGLLQLIGPVPSSRMVLRTKTRVQKSTFFFTHFRKTKIFALLGRVSRGKCLTLKVTRIGRSIHTYHPIFVTFSSCRRKGTRVYTQNRSRCCVPSRTTPFTEETLLPIERGKPPEARRLSSFSAASGSRRSRSPVTFPGTRARPKSYSLSVRIKVRRIRWCCTPGVRQSRRYVSEI